jgi:predicted RNA-binding protein with PIN domain
MPYLIDGHNLIPRLPGLSLKAIDDEQQLIDWLQLFCKARRKEVEVFFDRAPAGFPAVRKFGRVKARFIRQGATADDAIDARLQALKGSAHNYVVVSSDHQVQAAARRASARVLDSDEFARELLNIRNAGGPGSEDEPGPSPDQVAEWEARFKSGQRDEKFTR